ncbi:MAG TPA: ParB/RepB/Spo0J family partition protein [Chloroflexota bacterium]|nr:ParB/RepB/Spo0J family partition protein [Chloroflexota bacterium]
MLFGWTAPALLAGAKTCSRQTWALATARQFRDGLLVAAYDRDPRRRGRHLATLRLRGDPVYEPLSSMPDSDYAAEGWQWLYEHPLALSGKGVTREDFSWEAFERWRRRPYHVWVVRFEVVSLVEYIEGVTAEARRLRRQLDRELHPALPRDRQAAGEGPGRASAPEAPARTALVSASAVSPPDGTTVETLAGATRVPIEAIEPNPDQPRRGALPEIPELAAHIATYGLLQPIVVAPAPAGRYTLIAGARRLAAFRHLAETDAVDRSRWATIPAVARETAAADRLVLALAENVARHALGAADAISALHLLRDLKGWRASEIARHLGTSEAWVSRHFAIDADAALAGHVRSGRLTVAKAYEVYRAKRPGARERALEAALAGASLQEIRHLAQQGARPASERRPEGAVPPDTHRSAPGRRGPRGVWDGAAAGGSAGIDGQAEEVASMADELGMTTDLHTLELTAYLRDVLPAGLDGPIGDGQARATAAPSGVLIRALWADLRRIERQVRAASRRPGRSGRRAVARPPARATAGDTE